MKHYSLSYYKVNLLHQHRQDIHQLSPICQASKLPEPLAYTMSFCIEESEILIHQHA
ncbi:hypothetical protein Hanom_Chr05g00416491 [Helianthus anomalus]